jgi:hypothetical protein
MKPEASSFLNFILTFNYSLRLNLNRPTIGPF